MFNDPLFKKFFSIFAFVLLLGCPCLACEENHAVHEFLHHCEKKRTGVNGLRQYLKNAFSKLLRAVISGNAFVVQGCFRFSTASLPATHFNHPLLSSSSIILLL